MKPSDQEIATHEAWGHYPYRDWCRRQRAEQKFFTDEDDGEPHVFGGESQAKHDDLERACAMQGRGGPGSNQGNGRVVEQIGYRELLVMSDNEPVVLGFRDAVIREQNERFGVRAIAQAPPRYDVENAIKQVKEKV